jgi:hypothetical protein
MKPNGNLGRAVQARALRYRRAYMRLLKRRIRRRLDRLKDEITLVHAPRRRPILG